MSIALLDQILERVESLPHLPDTALRLVQIISNPQAPLTEIVDAVRYDQALTAEVLRLCNSAYFGLARTIRSLDDAVTLLGTVRVFQLVMAAHARTFFSKPQEGYGLPAGALWEHSVAVAIAAQALSRRLRLPDAGLLFTAGLLHDAGKIVLNEFVGREYAEIARRVLEERVAFTEAEQAVLGYTHAEVGARLAERWQLPPDIVDCIRFHHTPLARTPVLPLLDAVHLADAVAMMLGLGTGDDGLSYRAAPSVLERNQLTETDLESLGVETHGELRSVLTLFGRK